MARSKDKKGDKEWLSLPPIPNITSLSRKWLSGWSFPLTAVSLCFVDCEFFLKNFMSLLCAVVNHLWLEVPLDFVFVSTEGNERWFSTVWARRNISLINCDRRVSWTDKSPFSARIFQPMVLGSTMVSILQVGIAILVHVAKWTLSGDKACRIIGCRNVTLVGVMGLSLDFGHAVSDKGVNPVEDDGGISAVNFIW